MASLTSSKKLMFMGNNFHSRLKAQGKDTIYSINFIFKEHTKLYLEP